MFDGVLQQARLVGLGVGDELFDALPDLDPRDVEGLVVLEVAPGPLVPIRRPEFAGREHLAQGLHVRQRLGAELADERRAWQLAELGVVAVVPAWVGVVVEVGGDVHVPGAICLAGHLRQQRVECVPVDARLVVATPDDDAGVVVQPVYHIG